MIKTILVLYLHGAGNAGLNRSSEHDDNLHTGKQHQAHFGKSLYAFGDGVGWQEQFHKMKNYKVTSSRMYAGSVLSQRVYYYRWYWMADLRSWFEANFWGRDCNTFVRDGATVKPRPVVWK